MKISFRKITPADNAVVARIIRTVMPEFGASGPGFAIHDPEVDRMYETYSGPGHAYFVCEVNGQIVGGAGIGPVTGAPSEICELQKMYFLPVARGKGYGKQILKRCIAEARGMKYEKIYLETFHTMSDAIRLYEALGFKKIPTSIGSTGHFACDNFFLLALTDSL